MFETKPQAPSLSILVTVSVLRFIALFAIALVSSAPMPLISQESETKTPDNFFAGTVEVCTDQKLTVSRAVLGKTEKRDFKITSETKVEGKLRTKVRVTVRYESGEDGEIATLIVVRAPDQKK
jgi:hypothetical protein